MKSYLFVSLDPCKPVPVPRGGFPRGSRRFALNPVGPLRGFSPVPVQVRVFTGKGRGLALKPAGDPVSNTISTMFLSCCIYFLCADSRQPIVLCRNLCHSLYVYSLFYGPMISVLPPIHIMIFHYWLEL